MLQYGRFSTITVILACLIGLWFAVPNFLPSEVRKEMPSWLPSETINLGLDLQGGAYMLLEVDLQGAMKERMESLRGDVRAQLRKAKIGYANLEIASGAVTVRITDPAELAQARPILNQIVQPPGSVLGMGTQEYELVEGVNGLFTIRMTESHQRNLKSEIVSQSIEVVRRRIDELGTKEPTIQKQGDDRILVQVPGLQDPEQLKRILQTTAKMTFQLVDEPATADYARTGRIPPEDILLWEDGPDGKPLTPYAIQRRVMVSGERLTKASQDFSQQTGQAIVNFAFNSRGARQFGEATKNNVGRRFAIVLDNKVISAPVIRTAILGGSGYIEGNFTVKSAGELAVLLKAGALPAKLTPIETRTVGPDLGKDSIEAGKTAALYGLAAVVIFMIASYGLFGVFANLALFVNMILLAAILTLFQATLTLPGIAGIVLTMGMAVDSNVLIYERIREELRSGKSVIAAIDAGFQRATATIIDTNMTHVLAALVLFQLGVGPIRGFAVTLGVGVITSFFTVTMVTRLIVVTWLRMRRPKTLTI